MTTFWDERFSSEEYYYGTEPNKFFKQEIEKLTPGKLLMPCEGEGRNAVYAAKLGWDVYAFDTSTEGMKKALLLAQKSDVTIHYYIEDASDYLPTEKFDAIGLIFCHFHISKRSEIHRKFANSLNDGGYIIMEAFHKNQINNNTGGPSDLDLLYSAADLNADFSTLDIIKLEHLKQNLNEGGTHIGLAEVLQMTAKKNH